MVNLGCGQTFHRDWINFDLHSNSPFVKKLDIAQKLPFEDNSVDVCYSSHVLEHLNKNEGYEFIKEQYRILKKGGIIRVAVPDLEVICRNYLQFLSEVETGNQNSKFKYEYSYLELYDQVARSISGGELGALWRSKEIQDQDLDFILLRHGDEAMKAINADEHFKKKKNLNGIIPKVFYKMRLKITEALIFILNGSKYVRYYREGVFRSSGEIHKVMYDKYSLKKILLLNNFSNVFVVTANQSSIPSFDKYKLEVVSQKIRKPDSIFIEGMKP